MKITGNSINKAALMMTTMFFSSPMMVSAQMPDNVNGLTAEKLRPQFTNLTPEAASLGKFGAFQVSEYSGAANISIPLYTVKSGDVSFPINLNYDATGIKVEQDATMVGLGWNLSYGGMISHIVCGADDFWETSNIRDVKYYKDFWKNPYAYDVPSQCYFPHSVKMGIRWGGGSTPLWYSLSHEEHDWKFWVNLAQGYDIPDVFQANFCGHSLAFVIDCRHDFEVKILNDDSRKYKITYTSSGAPNYYPRVFTITDDKGISYQFSPYAENVNKNAYTNIDSYYLTKIYGADGESGKSVVDIQYDQLTTSYYGKGSRPQSKTHVSNARRIKSSNDMISGSFDSYLSVVGQNSYPQDIGCYQTGETYKVYPKKIITALETIEFSLGNRTDLKGAKSISAITIKSNGSQRNISFAYDYFSEDSPKADYSGKRLKLTGVTIDGQKYKFQYDDKAIPAFSSYSKDYWGYYNGANPNAVQFNASTPAYSISNGVLKSEEHFDGSNRLASEKLCNVGMLKKVIYPTGGYTCYEYEANRFNDKYYYPDASNYQQVTKNHTDFDVSMYGTMTQTKTFTASEANYDMKIVANINGTSDAYTVTVKNASGSVVKNLNYQGKKQLSENISLSLTKGTSYTVEMKLTAVEANRYSTVAQCTLSHNSANTITKNENGGYSIGGGLRIKSIKNYDSDNSYLNGVVYEYSGGKLLSPTVQIEKHFLDFPYEYSYVKFDDGTTQELGFASAQVRFAFYYANTEPSYSHYCSVGIPATVGYDQVIKKEIDKSGNVLRKTVFDFYNYGYVTDHSSTNQINERMQNCFFFNSYYDSNADHAQGHMNGKLKKETVYNGTVLASTTQYKYESVRQGFVQYPKCYPLYLKGYYVDDMKYDFAIYTKFNAWSYLTEKKETLYDSNGKQTTGNITQYAYNENNYQPMRVTVYDDKKQNSRCTCLYYPFDKGMAGNSDYLVQRHILSEVVRTYVYDDIFNTNTFVGGSYYNYVLRNNIPVVSECRSITPAWTTVQEMVVTKHDNYGNIREYKKKNGTPVTIIWSYNHQLPIMEIVGCTYDEACKKATSLSSLESKASVAETTISSIHSTLMKGLPNAYVTAYTYSPWQSVSQIIKPNGEKTAYSYDSYGRLSTVLDANQSTFQPILMYNYNYKNK